jgi:hypothetical protein
MELESKLADAVKQLKNENEQMRDQINKLSCEVIKQIEKNQKLQDKLNE